MSCKPPPPPANSRTFIYLVPGTLLLPTGCWRRGARRTRCAASRSTCGHTLFCYCVVRCGGGGTGGREVANGVAAADYPEGKTKANLAGNLRRPGVVAFGAAAVAICKCAQFASAINFPRPTYFPISPRPSLFPSFCPPPLPSFSVSLTFSRFLARSAAPFLPPPRLTPLPLFPLALPQFPSPLSRKSGPPAL